MDEHNELPDDLSQWPDNNWDLFNLDSQSATYNDLRKAYSRLVKQFRPETRPEHFQRIQEAFETLRDLIQSGKASNPDEQQNSDPENDKAVQQRRSKRQNEFLDELFNQYINNADWDGAKLFLESVIEPKGVSEEKLNDISDLDEIPFLYMFWLLYATNPSNEDNFSEIVKYLFMGEKAHQGDDISISIKTFFLFLERKELSYNDKVYDYALTNLGFPAVLFLANTHWLNLRFEEDVDDVDIILSDLEKLQKRFMPTAQKEWARINIEAVEHLLWINNKKAQNAIENCMDVISQYPDYRLEFDEKLDYLDRLEQMIDSLRKIPRILPANIDLIHTILMMSGNCAFTRYRRLVLKFVSELADDVLRAFMFFDYINLYHPLVASRLFDPMQQLYLSRHDNDSLTEEQRDNVIKRILHIWESHHCNYNASRLATLKYFLENRLDPSDVYKYVSDYCKTIEEDPNPKPKTEEIKKWRFEYLNDGAIALTYYAIMSCEIKGMEDYEEDDDDD